MLSMKETVDALQKAGLRQSVRVAVGGAPVTQRFCEEIGADFYAANATGAVTKAKELLPSA
jgi:5-methyltetrahydrofolate--homocysteine methyltransferase